MLLTPEEIISRSKAIRFEGVLLSAAAGMPKHTAARTLNRVHKPTFDNVATLSRALTDEELRLRDYLLGLHPLIDQSTRQAAE